MKAFVVVSLLSLRKKIQKVFMLSSELKETASFSANGFFRLAPPLEWISRDLSSPKFFGVILIFSSEYHFFLVLITFLSKNFLYFKLPLSIYLPDPLGVL